MLNPSELNFFNAREEKLQEFLLFAIMVANKEATQTAKKLQQFLHPCDYKPFEFLGMLLYVEESNPKYSGLIREKLTQAKIGQYSRIERAIKELLKKTTLDSEYRTFQSLRQLSFKDLTAIHGIGLKTASYFKLYTERSSQIGVLDTHILKYLRDIGIEDVPKSTPTSIKKYDKLQTAFLNSLAGYKYSIQDADLELWKYYSGKRSIDKTKVPHYNLIAS